MSYHWDWVIVSEIDTKTKTWNWQDKCVWYLPRRCHALHLEYQKLLCFRYLHLPSSIAMNKALFESFDGILCLKPFSILRNYQIECDIQLLISIPRPKTWLISVNEVLQHLDASYRYQRRLLFMHAFISYQKYFILAIKMIVPHPSNTRKHTPWNCR